MNDRRESPFVQPSAGQIVQTASAQLSAREFHLQLPVNCPERTGGYFVELPCFSTKNSFAGGGLLLGIVSGLHQIASVWCEPKQSNAAV